MDASQSGSVGDGPARLTLGAPRSSRRLADPSRVAATSSSEARRTTTASLPSTGGPSSLEADHAVRATDSDALLSRLSALETGYLSPEPFAGLFLTKSVEQTATGARLNSGAGEATGGPSRPGAGSGASHADHEADVSSPWPPRGARGGRGSPPPFASPFASPFARSSIDSQTRAGTAASLGGAPGSTSHLTPTRRPPVLNIGTYLRCTALDRVINAFIEQSGRAEEGQGAHIVSVGAGSDSRFWRIQSDPKLSAQVAHYTELDFGEITKAKVRSINKAAALSSVLQPTAGDGDLRQAGVHLDAEQGIVLSRQYSLFACDLRTLTREQGPPSGPSAPPPSDATTVTNNDDDERIRAHIRRYSQGRRTLVLAECVLAYLEPRDADALLGWFASLALPTRDASSPLGSDVLILSFDMAIEGSGGEVPGGGRFGKMMLQNIESRGLPLHGARAYSTPSAYTRRYHRILGAVVDGLTAQENDAQGSEGRLTVRTGSKTLTELWMELDGVEKQRISRLERLDEVEELEMLMDHYCISWGVLSARPLDIPL